MGEQIKSLVKRTWRYPICSAMRRRLANDNFVLLSSNCIAGCLLHDLGRQFDTPTINLVIPEFAAFCENWETLLSMEPAPDHTSGAGFPVFRLGEVELRGVHYRTDEAFLDAWNRRRERFLRKMDSGAELLLMATDAQLAGQDALLRFSNLPYRKVLFCANALDCRDSVIIPEFDGQSHVGDVTKYADLLGRRYFEKYFDCVSFINNGAV